MLSEQKGKELFTNFLQQLYWFRTLLLLVTVLEFFWIYNIIIQKFLQLQHLLNNTCVIDTNNNYFIVLACTYLLLLAVIEN